MLMSLGKILFGAKRQLLRAFRARALFQLS
jgi:hypothetical protein